MADGNSDSNSERGPDGDDDDRRESEGRYERETFDDPREHLVVERRRFQGGLPPTPELYALAREQWYALPGAVVRPPMDPPIAADPPGEGAPGGERTPQ